VNAFGEQEDGAADQREQHADGERLPDLMR
jgi:hypothetical protein